jgi:cobalt-zinc-cadmium efflux system membrane fusion protein
MLNMSKLYFISILLIGLISCKNKKIESNAKEVANQGTSVELTDAQLKNIDFKTSVLEKRNISSVLKVNGIIEVPPQNMVSVSVPMGGYLKRTQLLEGMHIKKGEVIATIEDQQYIQLQQDYLTAKAQFTSIESEYLRQKELNLNKASSDKVFQKAQADFVTQRVLIKSLTEKLKLIGINPNHLNENTLSRTINIYSPIDGFVSSVKHNIGKFVSPTEVLFELVNPTDIHLALTVFEKDLEKIAIGQKIKAFNNTQANKKYECRIILIGKDISKERSVTVHCHFEQYDHTLLPGMYMNAEIDLISNNAFVIPNDGLVRFEGKEYVFIQSKKNTYDLLEVITHNHENEYTQIELADGSEIKDRIFVTKGAYTLLMKMKNTEEAE